MSIDTFIIPRAQVGDAMGANNHPTTVPNDMTATGLDGVSNPFDGLDDETLMRGFAQAYSEVHIIGGPKSGRRAKANLYAMAQELDDRGLSGKRALDRHGVAEGAANE